MGNKKNQNKKSKMKANNWRGIIRMRKTKRYCGRPGRSEEGNDTGRSKWNNQPDTVVHGSIENDVPMDHGVGVGSEWTAASVNQPNTGFHDPVDNDVFVGLDGSGEDVSEWTAASVNQPDTVVYGPINMSDQLLEIRSDNSRNRFQQDYVQYEAMVDDSYNEIPSTTSVNQPKIVLEYQPSTTFSDCSDYFDEFIEIVDENDDIGTDHQQIRTAPDSQAFNPSTSTSVDETINIMDYRSEISEDDVNRQVDGFDETLPRYGSDSQNKNRPARSDTYIPRLKTLSGYGSDSQNENYSRPETEERSYTFSPRPQELDGRRIVDIKSLFNQIKQLRHSDTCHVEDMICTNEKKKGLFSTFEFVCTVCGHKQNVQSCNYEKAINVNGAAVLGITAVGLGEYHIKEIFANLEIPYDQTQKEQQMDWLQLAKESAMDALKEEIRLAILNGDVDQSGNALVLMICDGSWAKRSYKTNFSSLSGCAVIIGVRTNKVVYFGVKNKYCHICKIAESKGITPRVHECKKNFTGPSSSMETSILIEGFQFCEKFGLRFKEYISDGDSSTYKNISDLKIYQNPEQPIEKNECCNHVCRNYRNAFGKLAKGNKKGSVSRKLLTKKKGNDMCLGIQAAAKHWQNSNVDLVEKLTNLEKDIYNAPLHYFGVHDGCASYFCTKNTTPEGENNVDLLKKEGTWDKILNLCQRYFANNIPSLLLNCNNNAAESFNNIVAKLIGGKRVNYCLAHSYLSRVARAVVQYNTSGHAGSTYHEFKVSTPNSIPALKTLEESRKRKCKKNAIEKSRKPKKPRFSEPVREKGVHYGLNCQEVDMNEHSFNIAKARYLQPYVDDQANRDFIMRSTIGQDKVRKWRDMQSKYLTSWYFSRIVKARGPSSYTAFLNDIVYKKAIFAETADRRHQKIYEGKALACFRLVHVNDYLSSCGFFIDEDHCLLGASPFKLYGETEIVCVKCPLAAYKKTIHEAIEKKLINFWKIESGVEVVNTMSDWYIEIQGELHVSRKSFAFVIVWVGSEFRIEKVYRDDEFWADKMEPKLIYFCENVMLKELVNPRKRRHMKLRKYNTVTKVFE